MSFDRRAIAIGQSTPTHEAHSIGVIEEQDRSPITTQGGEESIERGIVDLIAGHGAMQFVSQMEQRLLLLRAGSQCPLSGFPGADIPGNFGCADYAALGVFERGDGQGKFQQRAIFSPAHGFEVIDALSSPESRDNLDFFLAAIERDNQRDRPSHRFGRRVAEHSFRGLIPTRDGAIEILADDCVVGGVDDRGQQAPGFLGMFPVGDVLQRSVKRDDRAMRIALSFGFENYESFLTVTTDELKLQGMGGPIF